MAANQSLSCFRKDPLAIRMQVQGVDLTNANPAFAVRLYKDAPGAALIQLGVVTAAGTDGIRLVGVVPDSDGISTTLLEIIASKTLMAALPAEAELGDDLTLAYDLQWTPPDDGSGFTSEETTVLFGDFIVQGSVNA